jgi:hypothetical protein
LSSSLASDATLVCAEGNTESHAFSPCQGQARHLQPLEAPAAASRAVRAPRSGSGLAGEAQGRFSYSTTASRPWDGVTIPAYPLPSTSQQEIVMGKYVFGWVLGVPVIVLVVAYFFFR